VHALTLNRSFFLLTFAFFAMCGAVISATVAAAVPASRFSALLVALVFGAVAGAILWFEGRRDLDAVLTLVASVLGITAMCTCVYLVSADDAGLAPKLAAPLTAIGAAACGVATFRRQRSSSGVFPNVLASHFPPGQIFETDGVQFTGVLDPARPGRPHFVSIILQNCFDSSRRVIVRLDAASHAKYLRFDPVHSIELAGAEVARLVLPVVAPTYPGSYNLYFSISVQGSTGRRIRLWRAQEATNRTTGGEMAALAVVGVIKWGGGIRFHVGPLLDDLWAAPLAPPSTESLWRPAPGTVPLEQSVA
jgi:hypothetical protein